MKQDEIFLKKLFIRFLKENNCYKQFIQKFEDYVNVYRNINKYNLDYIIHICHEFGLNVLGTCFICEKQNESSKINWYDLSEYWVKIINDNSLTFNKY